MSKKTVEHMVWIKKSGLVSQDNDSYKEMDGYKFILAQCNETSTYYD